ncbi:hypothetical protein ACSVDA_15725 [Cytobacillus sp. Hm23]
MNIHRTISCCSKKVTNKEPIIQNTTCDCCIIAMQNVLRQLVTKSVGLNIPGVGTDFVTIKAVNDFIVEVEQMSG